MIYNWDIVGHKKQLEQLEKELREENVSHAYLFSGMRESGKFRAARTFANILQCQNGLCGTCETCRLISTGAHPDTIVMRDNGESIKTAEVRELVWRTGLTSQGGQRIVVIQNIERMPIEAQNSFLKTLEEPPGKTIFILTASNIDQVLLTIQSRTRHYHFSSVDDKELRDYLITRFGQKPETDEAISMAQGRPGLAIKLSQNSDMFSRQKGIYARIESFLKKNDLSGKLQFIESIEKDVNEIDLFLDAFTRYLRKLIFEYRKMPYHSLSLRFSLEDLTKLFDVLEKTRYFIGRNVNKKLALENLLIFTEK